MSLERSLALLLKTYPRAYRERRGEEMLSVLLSSAAPGQRWPSVHEAVDLAWSGLRARLRTVAADRVALAGLGVSGVLVALAVLVLGQVLAERGQLAAADRTWSAPALPARLPAWDPIPAELSASGLGGPAVVAFVTGHEDGRRFQMLVGADGRTLRRGGGGWLSPDGARLAEGGCLVQVAGGRCHALPAGAPDVEVNDYRAGPDWRGSGAWSPDSRYFAWVAHGSVSLVDAGTDRWTRIGAATSVAFVGDDRIATTGPGGLRLQTTSGREVLRLPLDKQWRLSQAGASADGSMLALEPVEEITMSGSQPPRLSAVLSVATGQVTASAVPGSIVAWRGSTDVLLTDEGATDAGLAVLNLRTGRQAPVSAISPHEDASALQVASELTARASVLPLASSNRGPVGRRWPLLALAALAGAGALGVLRADGYLAHERRSVRHALDRSGGRIPESAIVGTAAAVVAFFFVQTHNGEAARLLLSIALAATGAFVGVTSRVLAQRDAVHWFSAAADGDAEIRA